MMILVYSVGKNGEFLETTGFNIESCSSITARINDKDYVYELHFQLMNKSYRMDFISKEKLLEKWESIWEDYAKGTRVRKEYFGSENFK